MELKYERSVAIVAKEVIYVAGVELDGQQYVHKFDISTDILRPTVQKIALDKRVKIEGGFGLDSGFCLFGEGNSWLLEIGNEVTITELG